MTQQNNISHKKTNNVDAIFNYVGFSASIMYIFIIIALILTLVVGSFDSISRFSFSFLSGKQWNIKQGVALSPVVSLATNTVKMRFSVVIKEQSLKDLVRLVNIDTGDTLDIKPEIKNRSIILHTALKNGSYEVFLSKNIKNSTDAPLIDSWRYTFSIANGKVYGKELIGEITGAKKNTNSEDTNLFGALPFLIGTVVSSLFALLLSTPFALAIAVYLNEYAKKTKKAYMLSSMIDLLAGIPSIIYGFCGMFFLAPYIGSNILTASIILAIMTLPYSTAMTREAIALVPSALRSAGYAMGATRYAILRHIVIPYAKSGIIAGIMLALGRALGETLAVTMVIGNSNRIPTSIFDPAQTISSLIANEYAEASGIKQSALIELGLLLIIITMFFSLLGRLLIRKNGAIK